MSYDSVRCQIDILVDHAIANGTTADEAYQAVIDAGAAYNGKLAELQDTLDRLDVPYVVWAESDEDECDE